MPTCDRCEIGERQRIFSSAETHCVRSCIRVFAVSDTVLLHRRFILRRARHSSAAQLVCALCRKAPANLSGLYHLSSQVLSVISRLTNRAAQGEITCVAKYYLTLRIGCERHGSKNPLPFPFSTLTQSTICTQATPQGKRVFKEGRNRRCLPFLPSAAGAAVCQEQQFGAHIDIFVCICYHKAQ